jgi:hypothetical protein
LSVVYIALNAQTTQIGNQLVGVSSNGSLFRSPSGQPLFEAPPEEEGFEPSDL